MFIESTPHDGTLQRGYSGPERRRSSLLWACLREALDELDHGVLLIGADRQVVLLNRAAVEALGEDHPLQVVDQRLRAREPQDVAPLHEAIEAAMQRGLRRALVLGRGRQRVAAALVPLRSHQAEGLHACMLSLSRPRVCDALAVQWFAQLHGLTAAESRVLARLCAGESPREVATGLKVRLSTVRTQIAAIRSKTHSADLRSLLQQVACLPPMVSTLYRAVSPAVAPAVAEPKPLDPLQPADPMARHGPPAGRLALAGRAG